jgi:hypothetical protein
MEIIASTAGVEIETFETGRMNSGVDFGSGNMVPLKQSKVGLMVIARLILIPLVNFGFYLIKILSLVFLGFAQHGSSK